MNHESLSEIIDALEEREERGKRREPGVLPRVRWEVRREDRAEASRPRRARRPVWN